MYQMLTGVLPYEPPAPSDLDRLMRGDLVSPPRLKNPAIPKRLSDIVLRAMAPELTARYQRASDLLEDVLALGPQPVRRPAPPREELEDAGAAAAPRPAGEAVEPVVFRARERDAAHGRFCWHCRKPLHARSDRCPFCGEAQ